MSKVRFAPSPTGFVHVGNIRTALINYLFAKKYNAEFLLRIDDTDLERSKQEYLDALLVDLDWLGIHCNEMIKQSDHIERYTFVQKRLIEEGLLYPCYETPEELDLQRKLQLKQGLPPIYDRHAFNISEEDKKQRKPHWRFALPDEEVSWDDPVRGSIHIQIKTMSDPILVREDGSFLYTLPSIVDDLDYGITHIFRGEDYISNTAVQIPIFKAISKIINKPFHIQFGHTSFLLGPNGEKLSKRTGSISVQDLREMGLEPMAILSYLRFLGTPDAIHACNNFNELLDGFDISKYGGNTPKFNPHDIELLNEKIFHHLPFAWLAEQGIVVHFNEKVWDLVKFNINKRSDISIWDNVFMEQFKGVYNGAESDFYAHALSVLPDEPWDETTWSTWVKAIDRKGGMPLLRKALTGMTHGPEMKLFLPLLGYEKVRHRLVP